MKYAYNGLLASSNGKTIKSWEYILYKAFVKLFKILCTVWPRYTNWCWVPSVSRYSLEKKVFVPMRDTSTVPAEIVNFWCLMWVSV